MRLHALFLLTPLFCLAQTAAPVTATPGTPPPPTGTAGLRGIVVDAATGQPLPDADIRASIKGANLPPVKSDAQGRFQFRDLPAGNISLFVTGKDRLTAALPASRQFELQEKQTLEGVEVRLQTNGEISGTIIDDHDKPVSGAVVWLVAREYSLGELKYIMTTRGKSDENGRYTIRGTTTGRAHLLMAMKSDPSEAPVSDAPAEVAQRTPAFAPTFYPGTELPQGAQTVTIPPASRLERIDFRIHSAPSYCAEGVLQSPNRDEAMRFEITRAGVTPGSVRGLTVTMNYSLTRESRLTGPDGRFRVCGLTPGPYRIEAYSDGAASEFYGVFQFTIVDRDVKEIAVIAAPRLNVPVRLEWADREDREVSAQVALVPMIRMSRSDESLSVKLTGPEGMISRVFMGDYRAQISQPPSGTYIKDILYAGQSVLDGLMRVGSGVGGGDLRVILGNDGGRVRVRTEDRDGKSISETTVVLIPSTATTEGAIASGMHGGLTGQDGAWTSTLLPPGKYIALTTRAQVDYSPESIARILSAKSKGREIEISPGGTTPITLVPDLF